MATISILPENSVNGDRHYRAVAGTLQSAGKTPGEALDALTLQMDANEAGTLVVVQQMRPDRFFTAEQQERLAELMKRWRIARSKGAPLPLDEQAELNELSEAELNAAAARASELVRQLNP